MLSDWSNFFIGELGAAAALAGLLFVSISVNQSRILQLGRMADRGLEALMMLLLVLVIASLGLVPGQPLWLLGAEIFLVAALAMIGMFALERSYLRHISPQYRRVNMRASMCNQASVGILAVSGLVMMWRGGVGLYLQPVGILLTFLLAMANAWVLLIEINR